MRQKIKKEFNWQQYFYLTDKQMVQAVTEYLCRLNVHLPERGEREITQRRVYKPGGRYTDMWALAITENNDGK